MFKNKTLLVTGGTGSLGQKFIPMTLKKFNLKKIIIFSRDEMKQWEMAKKFEKDKRVRFFLGDVRDKARLNRALDGIDLVVHAAATKIVPTAEYNPFEAVKTNILGTENVLEAAISSSVEKVICLSTDKAVYPINAMGISKAMMEKVIVAKGRSEMGTMIACTRYGNVMASRGSVIPLFISQIKNNKIILLIA